MGAFSIWHILILAVLVMLLFGGNRFSSMMGDIAKGMKSFKQGLADDDEDRRRLDERTGARRDPPRQVRDERGYDDPRRYDDRRDPIDITPERDRDPRD